MLSLGRKPNRVRQKAAGFQCGGFLSIHLQNQPLNVNLPAMETEEFVSGQAEIVIDNTLLKMNLTLPAKPVKARRMLPVINQLAGIFVDMGVAKAEGEGRAVSCQKGCSACCSQPVPIAEFEAYNLAEVVVRLPEPRRAEVIEKFDAAVTHFARIGWFEKFQKFNSLTAEGFSEVLLEYMREDVSCPFLLDGACSIYEDRPLVCREYLVTNPPENCADPNAENLSVIKIPIAPSQSLLRFGQSEPLSELNIVPLIMSLRLAITKPENAPEKTGAEWMQEFFQSVTKGEIPENSAERNV